MSVIAPLRSLPFQVGEARSFRALTLVPLFPARDPVLGYVGLDEALASGLRVSEVGGRGLVGALVVSNPLPEAVLLYEGETLTGAKQDRAVDRTLLVPAGGTVKIPVTCVEQGRWRWHGPFRAAPHAAYPELRRATREGQAAAWAAVADKARRLGVRSATGAADALYRGRRPALDPYLQALPRAPGQAGVIAAVAGRLVCLDYVSRPEVFAGLYGKLLRGYALDALEAEPGLPLSAAALGRFLGELELAPRTLRAAPGLGEEGILAGYVVGRELVVAEEPVALAAFPARP